MEKSIPGRATSAKDGPEKHFLSQARQKRAARAKSGVWGRERSVKVKANEKRAISSEDMALFICCLCNSRIFYRGKYPLSLLPAVPEPFSIAVSGPFTTSATGSAGSARIALLRSARPSASGPASECMPACVRPRERRPAAAAEALTKAVRPAVGYRVSAAVPLTGRTGECGPGRICLSSVGRTGVRGPGPIALAGAVWPGIDRSGAGEL